MNFTHHQPAGLTGLCMIALMSAQLHAASAIPSVDDSLKTNSDPTWTLHTAYSHSLLNNGFGNWDKETVDLYHFLPDQKLLLGLGVDFENRSGGRDDVTYRANAAWYTTDIFEVHTAIEWVDDAEFLPSESYLVGMKYRYDEHIEVLFDLEQMEFSDSVASWDDGITQIGPGVTWWFNDQTRITFKYIHGWVHHADDYDYYVTRLDLGNITRDGRLTFTLAYGTDPDFNYGTGTTDLSDAYLVSIFYTEPITEDLTVYGGIEYVYRMRPTDNGELYQMWTPTIGLSWKF